MNKQEYIEKYGETRYQEYLEYHRQYYKKNKSRISEWSKKYYLDNKEEIIAYGKEYRKQNIDASLESHRKYYREHKSESQAQQKVYRDSHKEEKRAYNQKYYKEHKAEMDAYSKAYQATPIGRAKGLISKYKILDKKHNRGECTLTDEYVVNILFPQGCYWCGKTDYHELGCDRIDNSKPHTPDNVVCSCWDCNNERRRMSFEEFSKLKGVA